MKNVTILTIVLFSIKSYGQPHIKYMYDDNGNRTHRNFVPLRLAETQIEDSVSYHNMNISVYPNPVYETFHISINNDSIDYQECKITIADASGKRLYNARLSMGMNEISFSSYTPGVYYLQIRVDKEVVQYKIVKLSRE